MSVHRKRDKWVTRWREGDSNRSRSFDRKRDAQAWDGEVRSRQRLGTLGLLDTGRQTLDDFAAEWWKLYAEPNLATRTQVSYAELWDRHVLPRIGGMELREVTPEVLEQFGRDLRRAGVGEPTISRTFAVISGMFAAAVRWGRIQRNPVTAVRKPKQPRTKRGRAVPPRTVEKIRTTLLANGRRGDAALVSVLAYAGLRPGEALALRWRDIGDRVLDVERANADGVIGPTKTGQRRSVKILGPVAQDLREWQLASGRPPTSAFVFPRRDGDPWRETDYRNWRRRIYRPAAKAAGEPNLRVYDLRHTFVSLFIAEGKNIVEVAAQTGNSPTVTLDVYGHVIEEFSGGANGRRTRHKTREDVPLRFPRQIGRDCALRLETL